MNIKKIYISVSNVGKILFIPTAHQTRKLFLTHPLHECITGPIHSRMRQSYLFPNADGAYKNKACHPKRKAKLKAPNTKVNKQANNVETEKRNRGRLLL